VLAVVVTLAISSLSSGQGYPFFVQPMTVEDVREVASALDLSQDQQLALLAQYETYNRAFEELQEEDVRAVMDRGMDLTMRFRWWGGEISIPSREEVNGLISDSLRAIRSFERIDEAFFDSIVPLLSDSQLVRLDYERNRRAINRLGMLHRNVVGEINDGASPDLFGIMQRVDVDPQVRTLVAEELGSHADRMRAILRRLESAARDVAEKLLDEVDRLGLRSMDMPRMMEFFADEERQEELKGLFDVLSKPMQEAAAAAAKENARAYRSLIDVLPPEVATEVRIRFLRKGYREAIGELGRQRTKLSALRDRLEGTPAQGEIEDMVVQIDEGLAGMETAFISVLNEQRAYRTMAQLEGDVPMVAEDRVASLESRRASIESRASDLLKRLQGEYKEALEEEDGKSGGGRAEVATDEIDYTQKMEIAPLSPEEVAQMGRWFGAEASTLDMMGILQQDYAAAATALIEERGREAVAAYQSFDWEQGNWQDRQNAWRAAQRSLVAGITDLETALFADLSAALPDEIDRARIEHVRAAISRSRERSMTASGDWQLEENPEASVDFSSLILAVDPSGLDAEARRNVLDLLIEYDAEVGPLVDALAERIDAVAALEEKLWGRDNDYDPEIQAAMQRRWEQRREEVSLAASELAQLNQETVRRFVASSPESIGWSIQDIYDRMVFPGIFEAGDHVREAVSQIGDLELSASQRQQFDGISDEWRSDWGSLSRDMVDNRRSKGADRIFPPTKKSMSSAIDLERLKYRRTQLDQRTLVQLELILDPTQRAAVPALARAGEAKE